MKKKTEYRKTLGQFATGVTIITTSNDGKNYGFTANSFTSVSLDPPMVLFCVKKDSFFIEALKKSNVFGINILSQNQVELSNKFANPAILNEERFKNVHVKKSALNCPIIEGSIAFLDCKKERSTKVGDHVIVLGKVIGYKRLLSEPPLVYFGGGYRNLLVQ